MGSHISSLDYKNIIQIIDLPDNNINKNKTNNHKHLIKYKNGKEKKVSFNKDEEKQFQLRYKYTKMFKPLINLQYSKITLVNKREISKDKYIELNKNVLDEDDKIIYNIQILYNNIDDGMYIMNMNKCQYDLFCKIKDDIDTM
jgi:hypothetical protein